MQINECGPGGVSEEANYIRNYQKMEPLLKDL